MNRLTLWKTLSGIFLVLLGCGGQGCTSDTDTGTHIEAKPPYRSQAPRINNLGWVVWHRHDGDDHEIFLHEDEGDHFQIVDNAHVDRNPQINDQNQMVWQRYDGTDSEIFLHQHGGETIQLTDNDLFDAHPQINSQGWVTWTGQDSHDREIFLYKGQGDNIQITQNEFADFDPQISDQGWVVWTGFDGHDREIFLYKGEGSPIQITDNEFDDYNPHINGQGSVVWHGFDGNDIEIFLYKSEGEFVQLTHNDSDDTHPRINSQGQVVWQGHDANDTEIFLYQGDGEPVQLTNNDFDDNDPQINDQGWVAWHGFDGTDNEIFLYKSDGELVQVTDNDVFDHEPQLNNRGQVTWSTHRGSKIELWKASSPPVNVASGSLHSRAGILFESVTHGVVVGLTEISFSWILGAMGLSEESDDSAAELNLVAEELDEIEVMLGDMATSLASIEQKLTVINCTEQKTALTDDIARIKSLESTFNGFITDANNGQSTSLIYLADWADQVLAQGDYTAHKPMSEILATIDQQLYSFDSGIIPDCIATLAAPANNTVDDTDYYDQVAQITNYYYHYQVLGLLFLTEALHYKAWEEAGSWNSHQCHPRAVPTVCEAAPHNCNQAASDTNTVYNALMAQLTRAGAPYTNDNFLMHNHSSQPRLWVKSMEAFSTAAGDNCPLPLDSANPCGILAQKWDSTEFYLWGIDYRGFIEWHFPTAAQMTTLLSGWTSGTPGQYLENTFGFENMQNKILYSNNKTGFDIILQPSEGVPFYPQLNIGPAIKFIDVDLDKSVVDQPVRTQEAFGQLWQTGTVGPIPPCGMDFVPGLSIQYENTYEWLPFERDANTFYLLDVTHSACQSSTFEDSVSWRTKPGWLANNNARLQYKMIVGMPYLFTDNCTEGRASKNPGGVWTMCGDNFTQWLNDAVPRPPACDDATIVPACVECNGCQPNY